MRHLLFAFVVLGLCSWAQAGVKRPGHGEGDAQQSAALFVGIRNIDDASVEPVPYAKKTRLPGRRTLPRSSTTPFGPAEMGPWIDGAFVKCGCSLLPGCCPSIAQSRRNFICRSPNRTRPGTSADLGSQSALVTWSPRSPVGGTFPSGPLLN